MASDVNSQVRRIKDCATDLDTVITEESSAHVDSTFVSNDLDLFINCIDSLITKECGKVANFKAENDDACAVTLFDKQCLSVSEADKADNKTGVDKRMVVFKEYKLTKILQCFNSEIKLTQNHSSTRKIKFFANSAVDVTETVNNLRFPNRLTSCYSDANDHPVPTNSISANTNDDEPVSRVYFKSRRRGKRNRLSLYDQALNHDDVPNDRNVLPSEEEVSTVYDKLFNYQRIPFIYKCLQDSTSCSYKCGLNAQSFSLFMAINCGTNVPVPSLVRENIETLKKDNCVVDELSAFIASSAVRRKHGGKRSSRIFIPVAEHLKSRIGCFSQMLFHHNIPTCSVVVDDSINQVMDDMLSFVVRQEEFGDIKTDLDDTPYNEIPSLMDSNDSLDTVARGSTANLEKNEDKLTSPKRVKKRKREENKVIRELRKLTNVSVTDEHPEAESNSIECLAPSCRLGCICLSLKGNSFFLEHCGLAECMFGCECSDQTTFTYVNRGDLAKDEKTWHQTVIRKRNNDLEIKSGIERSKRETKVPTRYRIDRFGGERRIRLKRSVGKQWSVVDNKKPVVAKKQDEPENKSLIPSPPKITPTKEEPPNRINKTPPKPSELPQIRTVESLLDRKITLCSTRNAQTLADVLIWCADHSVYDCHCANWVVLLKNNNFLLNFGIGKPNLERIVLDNFVGRRIILFDMETHCARSVGSLINYRVRNSSVKYKQKLFYCLNHNVLSYSNGYLKAQPLRTVRHVSRLKNVPFVSLVDYIHGGVGNIVGTPENVAARLNDTSKLYKSAAVNQLPKMQVDIMVDDMNSTILPKPTKTNKANFRPCFSVVNDQNRKFRKKQRQIQKCSTKLISHSNEELEMELLPEDDEIVALSDDDVESVPKDNNKLEIVSLSDDDDVQLESVEFEENKDGVEDVQKSSPASEDDDDDVVIITPENSDVFGRKFEDGGTISSCSSPSPDTGNIEDDFLSDSSNLVIAYSDEETDAAIASLIASADVESKNPEKRKHSEVLPSTSNQSHLTESSTSQLDMQHGHFLCSTTKEEEYANFGLFCMKHPELGYLRVLEAKPGNLVIEDPYDNRGFRIFKDYNEASEFMKNVIFKYNRKCSSGSWVLVMRGVLEKYKCQKFNIRRWTDSFEENSSSSAAKKMKSSDNINESSNQSNNINTKDSARPKKSPPKKIDLLMSSDGSLLNTTAPTGTVILNRQLTEINRVPLKSPNIFTLGSKTNNFIRTPTKKGSKTVIIHAPNQNGDGLTPRVIKTNAKLVRIGSVENSKSASQTVSQNVSNQNGAGLSPTETKPTTALVRIGSGENCIQTSSHKTQLNARPISLTFSNPGVPTPSTFHSSLLSTKSKDPAIMSKISSPKTIVVRPIVNPICVGTSLKQKGTPRGADVILPKKGGLTALISAAPVTEKPSIVNINKSLPGNNIYNGVLINKFSTNKEVATTSNEIRPHIYKGKQRKSTKYQSLLLKR